MNTRRQARGVGGAIAGALMVLTASGALAALTMAQARAQAWPTRPILAVIPFSAGNANDVVGRVVLDQLSQQLGEPIVIENRAGAGGTTGVSFVAKAAPDGYTILVHSSTFSAAQAIYKSLPYDTLHDFASIIPLGLQPTVLVASPSKGWKTVADLITAAKAKREAAQAKREAKRAAAADKAAQLVAIDFDLGDSRRPRYLSRWGRTDECHSDSVVR